MKQFKKILALLLTTGMVVSMGIMAFTESTPTGKITVQPNQSVSLNGKTIKAYKILDATYGTNASGSVNTIAYSVPTALKDKLKELASVTGPSGAKTEDQLIVEWIASIGTDSEKMQNFVKAVSDYLKKNSDKAAALLAGTQTGSGTGDIVFDNLDSGYYLIVDEGAAQPLSALMLDTVTKGEEKIVIKANKTTPNKEIIAASGSTGVVRPSGTVATSTSESNNLGVGSTVNYQLVQNVPNYNGYEYFYFVLNDTLSKGLTFNNDVKVFIDIDGNGSYDPDTVPHTTSRTARVTNSGSVLNSTITYPNKTETLKKDIDFYVYPAESANADGSRTFQVAFENIMEYPIDATIVVQYSATVNSDAVTGYNPNTNEAYIEFSNKPSGSKRWDEGSGTSGSKKGIPDTTHVQPLGSGSKDYTTTYTTEIKVQKTDGTNPLPGAQFTLTGSGSQVVIKEQDVYKVDPNGTYWLLKDGTYTTTAPSGTAAAKMVPAKTGATSGYIAVSASDNSATDEEKAQWVTVGGTTYRPYIVGDSGSVFVLQLPDTTAYDSTVTKYSKTTERSEEKAKPVLVSKVVGLSGATDFIFKQLGAGHYTLSETKVPEGFNKAQDITFEIQWTAPSGSDVDATSQCGWKITNIKQGGKDLPDNFFDTLASGTFETTIVNRSGVELPSTGGIGTTIFYVLGAILVMFGGVLLVTKRRAA